MKANDIERLEQAIERLVREHVAECGRRAMEAVARGFAAGKRPLPRRRAKAVLPASARRSGDALATLTERLHAAVCARPGAAMAALASEVGASARELELPARRLKKAGRIRSVGERNATRYFPVPAKKSAS